MQRILLWDIDGTLVSGRGAGIRALQNAVKSDLSATAALGRLRLNGMTDRKIARIIVGAQRHQQRQEVSIEEHELAVTNEEIDTFLAGYLAALQAVTSEGPTFQVKPGVWDVLNALGPDRAVHGLGTGNIELGAKAKLEPIGLWVRFPFGGFGSDAEERADVLRAGHRKAEIHLGRACAIEEVVVIGDTPRDVAAAHAAGFACVAVATGGHSVEELIECGAELVLQNLAEPDAANRIVAIRRS